jgi:hypothetical protein
MEQGFVIDHGDHFSESVMAWVSGAPRKLWIGGLSESEGTLPIGVFRCTNCGYLESYARPEFKAQR